MKKKGRKSIKKQEGPQPSTEDSENSKNGQVVVEKPAKNKPGRKAKVEMVLETDSGPGSKVCGKCDAIFPTLREFKIHAATSHGGVAKLKQDDPAEELTAQEIRALIKEAFKYSKKVSCYICLELGTEKTFNTAPGIYYHLQSCGKTEAELDASKVQCSQCSYKGLPSNLRFHFQSNHYTRVEKKEEIEEELVNEATGRRSRRAASKATQRLSYVLKMNEEDPHDIGDIIGNADESEDEEFDLAQEKFKKLASGKLSCQICQFKSLSKKAMQKHVLENHNDEENEDDDYESEKESSIASEPEDLDDDIVDDNEDHKALPGGYRRRYSKGVLDLDRTIMSLEKEFRDKNYFQNAFEHLQAESWKHVDLKDLQLDFEDKSVKICVNSEQPGHLKHHQAQLNGTGRLSFFTGGSITASDWCPASLENGHDLIALSTERFDPLELDPLNTVKNVNIQFWSFNSKERSSPSCTLALVLQVKNVTRINGLKWCPSLKLVGEKDQRLGILAAACSDSTVKLFTLTQDMFKQNGQVALMLEPSLTLKRTLSKLNSCLKLSWYRGKGHRVIAGAFADGTVSIWDLSSKSPLLTSDRGCLTPLHTLNCHPSTFKFGLTLSENDGQIWPQYLLTGSSDKKLCLWDLCHPKGPTLKLEQPASSITEMVYVSHYDYDTFALGFDDYGNISVNRVMLYDTQEWNERGIGVTQHNSSVLAMDFSPFLNVLFSASAAGEVLVYVGEEDRKSIQKLKNSKTNTTRRAFVYRSSLNSGFNELENVPTYAELTKKEDLTIEYTDTCGKLMALSDRDKNLLKEKDGLPPEDQRKYPLLSVSHVRISPNIHSKAWIFTAAQSGIARLLYMPELDVK